MIQPAASTTASAADYAGAPAGPTKEDMLGTGAGLEGGFSRLSVNGVSAASLVGVRVTAVTVQLQHCDMDALRTVKMRQALVNSYYYVSDTQCEKLSQYVSDASCHQLTHCKWHSVSNYCTTTHAKRRMLPMHARRLQAAIPDATTWPTFLKPSQNAALLQMAVSAVKEAISAQPPYDAIKLK